MVLHPKRKGDAFGPPPKHMATIEHLRRVADGGDNCLDNLAMACWECNNGRGTMNWVEYKTVRAELWAPVPSA